MTLCSYTSMALQPYIASWLYTMQFRPYSRPTYRLLSLSHASHPSMQFGTVSSSEYVDRPLSIFTSYIAS